MIRRWDLKSLNQWSVLGLALAIPLSTVGTYLALSLLVISWFFSGDLKNKVSLIIKDPICQATAIFFGVFCLGLIYTQALENDAISMISKMSKWLFFPFVWSSIHHREDANTVDKVLIIAILIGAIAGWLQWIHWVPKLTRFAGGSVFRDPIFTSLMVAWTLFLMFHKQGHANGNTRLLYWVGIAFLCFYLFSVSTGRSGYIIFVLLTLLSAWQLRGLKGVMFVFLGLSLILSSAYLSQTTFYNRINVIHQELIEGDAPDRSIRERLRYVKQTWNLAKKHPWLGHGTGSFKAIFSERTEDKSLPIINNPHNEYLNVFFQCGLLGLAAMCYLFFTIYRQSVGLKLSDQFLAQGLLMTLIVGCMGNSWLMDFTSGYFFIMMIARVFSSNFWKMRVKNA